MGGMPRRLRAAFRLLLRVDHCGSLDRPICVTSFFLHMYGPRLHRRSMLCFGAIHTRLPLAVCVFFASVLSGVLDGIDGLYGIGVLHRDIKPDNILVRPPDTGILVDFGMWISTEEAVSGNDLGAGTVDYAAPETATDGWTLSAELYAVFVCLIEGMTGRVLFGREVRGLIRVKTEGRGGSSRTVCTFDSTHYLARRRRLA